MSSSFYEDLVYLGKVLLLTFMLLSCLVIFNQKYLEGIILISICFQIILIWAMINKFGLSEFIEYLKPAPASYGVKGYLFLLLLIISFFIGIVYLFRALVITQQSINNYGGVKSNFYNDILFAAVIGAAVLILFVILLIVGNKIFNKTSPKAVLPMLIVGISLFMLSNHIFHNF